MFVFGFLSIILIATVAIAQGAQPMPSSAAQLARLLNEDISSWRTIIRNAKVSLD